MKKSSALALVLFLGVGLATGLLWQHLNSRTPQQQSDQGKEPGKTERSSPDESVPTLSFGQAKQPEEVRTDITAKRSLAQDSPATDSSIPFSGSVLLPANTPNEEVLWVEALRTLEDEVPLARARVAKDGSYQLHLNKDSKEIQLRLDSQYLYLRENDQSLRLPKDRELPTLEPRLGARLELELILPTGAKQEWDQFSYFFSGSSSSEKEANFQREQDFYGFKTQLRAIPIAEELHLKLTAEHLCHLSGPVPALLPGEDRKLALRLELASVLGGRVLDTEGLPIPKALVQAADDRWYGHDVYTDEVGQFRIGGLLASDGIRLRAWCKNYKESKREFEDLLPGEKLEDIEIILERGFGLAGRVLWPDGSPVNTGWIDLIVDGRHPYPTGNDPISSPRSGAQAVPQRTPLNAEGSFSFEGLTDQTVELHAWAPERLDPSKKPSVEGLSARLRRKALREYENSPHWHAMTQVSSGKNELVLTLEPGLILTGQVLDDLEHPPKRFSVAAVMDGQDSELGKIQVFRTQDGSFKLTGLCPGRYEVHAEATGCQDSEPRTLILAKEQATTQIQLMVERLASARGIVLSNGVPVPDASVSVVSADDLNAWSGINFADKTIQADEQGQFAFKRSVPPGRVNFTAKARDQGLGELKHITVAPGAELTGLEIQIIASASLNGHILAPDGLPAAHWSVSLLFEETGQKDHFTTNSEGLFQVPSLAAGRYTVRVGTDMKVLRSYGQTSSTDPTKDLNLQTTIELASGEKHFLTLETGTLTELRVFGKVQRGSIPPAAPILVSLEPYGRADRSNQATVATDPSGNYELTLRGGGSFLAEWSVVGSPPKQQVVEIPLGVTEFELNLQLNNGALRGRVLGPDQSPAAEHEVLLRPLVGTSAPLSIGSDEDGQFVFHGLSAGDYCLNARGPQGAGWVDSVTIPEGETAERDIHLRASGRVTGHVINASGTGLEFCGVRAHTSLSGGGFLAQGYTDETGRFSFNAPATELFIRAYGWHLGQREVTRIHLEPGQTAEVELRLDPAGEVTVQVFDLQGKPRAAKLQVLDANQYDHAFGQQAAGIAHGQSQSVHGLPPGTFTVIATLPSGGSASEVVEVHAGNNTVLKIQTR